MNIDEIDKITSKMLATFINELGLDGDFFISNRTCPMVFIDLAVPGKYISPGDKNSINRLINTLNLNDNAKKVIKRYGIIKINKKYLNKEQMDADFWVNIIHEKIHSYRNLLIYDAYIANKQSSFLSNDDHFEQNSNNYKTYEGDASQNILHGSIDTSKKTIDKYKDMSLNELESLEFSDDKLNIKMEKQQAIDEPLVELMAIYRCKESNTKFDVYKELEKIIESVKLDDDIIAMSKIILRHHDTDLFHWMLDPMSYQAYDIHYDFFAKYTKNDKDLLDELYKSSNLGIDDDLYDKEIESLRR